jgi:predicted ribosome quality control (RQC) complex YloA/Tae2 family protein
MDENDGCYSDRQMIDILNEGLCNFVPIIHKISVPNKPVEKHARLSLSKGVQSKNVPVDALALHPVSCSQSTESVSVISIASTYITGAREG